MRTRTLQRLMVNACGISADEANRRVGAVMRGLGTTQKAEASNPVPCRISRLVNDAMEQLEKKHPLAYQLVRVALAEIGQEGERQEKIITRLALVS